jgi:two-component system, sensor histidine kinase LadS
MRGLLYLLLALAIGFASNAMAEPAVPALKLDSNIRSLELTSYTSYAVDESNRADASQMFDAASRGEFKQIPGGSPAFSFQKGTYWFHTQIYNNDIDEQRWLLVLQYPLLDHINVYARYPDGTISHYSSGDRAPFASRSVGYRMPNFWINLPYRTNVEILVSAQSESSMQVPLKLYTPAAFAEMEGDAQLWLGMYEGILFAMLFYNLILWITLRDANHFWYMFHVGGFGLVLFCLNGLAYEYLWPNTPWLANMAIPLSMCLSQIGMHQFARRFLELKHYWPRGDMIARGFIAYFILLGISAFFVDYATAVKAGTAAVFPGVLFILYTTYRSIRHGYEAAKLFLIAWSALLAGTALYASLSFGLVGKNIITEYGIQIGSALEMILLSFALAYRYANLRTENEGLVQNANEQLERNVSKRTQELSLALEQLAEANSRLRESSRRDSLTGIYNRRHFREVFEQMIQQSYEQQQPLGIALLDVDHFKRINDTHGHLAGDDCLQYIANMIEGALPSSRALAARFGGEEFVIALPNSNEHNTADFAEHLRQLIESRPYKDGGLNIALSASIGIYTMPAGQKESADQLLHYADDALYEAKSDGRNCVRVGKAA